MEDAVRQILAHFKADINDPSFKDTPKRFKKALEEILHADGTKPPELRCFPAKDAGDVIMNAGLTGTSLCPHHLLPYLMEASFAYIPDGKVVGVSKPGRLLSWLCGALVLQESIGPAFLEIFEEVVKPKGSIILIRGVHLCNTIRGAKQEASNTTTLASRGLYKSNINLRQEFLGLVRQK